MTDRMVSVPEEALRALAEWERGQPTIPPAWLADLVACLPAPEPEPWEPSDEMVQKVRWPRGYVRMPVIYTADAVAILKALHEAGMLREDPSPDAEAVAKLVKAARGALRVWNRVGFTENATYDDLRRALARLDGES
jgi:hypothetical protein